MLYYQLHAPFWAFFKAKMALELKTHPSYKPEEVSQFFLDRGWEVTEIEVIYSDSAKYVAPYVYNEAGILVPTDQGASLECIDGRFANRSRQVLNGPKIPGGTNSIAAVKTGGDAVGFNAAAKEAERFGFRAGTHKHCGFFDLWRAGKLEAARFSMEFPEYALERNGGDAGHWIKLKNRFWQGFHFSLPGEHEEMALRFNPYIGTTLLPRRDKFSYDHWLMQSLGVHRRRAMRLVAETVEQLAQGSKRLEIVKR